MFFHLHISFFPHTWHVYSHSIIHFQRFLGIPLNEFGLFYIHDSLNIPLLTQQLWIDIKVFFWNWKLDFKLIMFAKLDLQTYIFEKYWIFCKPELTYRSETWSKDSLDLKYIGFFANQNWHTGQIVIQTNSNPVLVFSNITWSGGDQKYQFYTFNTNFGKLGPVK